MDYKRDFAMTLAKGDTMYLQLTHLLRCPLLSKAVVWPVSSSRESWLCQAKLVYQMSDLKGDNAHTLLLADAHALLHQPWLLTALQQAAKGKQETVILIKNNAGADWQTAALFAETAVPIIEAPADLDFLALVRYMEQLVYSWQTGECYSKTQQSQELYQAFQTNSLKKLLQEMSRWLQGQLVCTIQQDVYVYPSQRPVEKSIFYPETWQKLPPPPELQQAYPQVSCYRSRTDACFFLYVPLVKNKLPYGSLILSKTDADFSRTDYAVLHAGAMLCLGLDPVYDRSQAISDLLCAAYKGSSLPDSEQLFPDSGYAIVLRLAPCPEGAKLDQAYIGYLMHFYFPNHMRYCFFSQDILLVFAATDDCNRLAQSLSSLVKKAHPRFTLGVSGQYPKGDMHSAFFEAKHAADIGRLLANGQDCFFFPTLGIYQLLSYPEYSWPINKMLDDMTTRLQEFEPAKRDALTATLECLVENNYNYKKTSSDLFTHVNTVRYRIGILEKLWNCDLNRDDDKLLFSLIAKLLPLWMSYKKERQNEGEK